MCFLSTHADTQIYAGKPGYPEGQVPAALKSNRVDLLYVTDRGPETDSIGYLAYGSERSDSIAFGSVVVEIGEGITSSELVRASQSRDRSEALEVIVSLRSALDRFPATPHPFSVQGGALIEDQKVMAEQHRVKTALRAELNRRLAATDHKEVFIYVHGGLLGYFVDRESGEFTIYHLMLMATGKRAFLANRI